MTPAQTLDEGLRALPLALSPEARERLLTYLALIAKWNRTHNLTAIREPLVMVTHHLLDSLAVVPHLFAEPRPQTLISAPARACRGSRSRLPARTATSR